MRNFGQAVEPTKPEFEKLRLEIADLKWKVGKIYKLAQVVSIFSAVVAVGAFLAGLYEFNSIQKRESEKPIREKQLALSFELSEVVAKLATLKSDDPEREKAKIRFHELRWGPIAFVEDEQLQDLMKQVAKCLAEYAEAQARGDETYSVTQPDGCTSPDQQENRLKELSLNLAVNRRDELGTEWHIPVSSIHESRALNVPSPQALP